MAVHLHVAVHRSELVHFSLFPASPLLYGFVIVVELVIWEAGAKVWGRAIGPVVRGPREARGRAREQHARVRQTGIQFSWSNGSNEVKKVKKKERGGT